MKWIKSIRRGFDKIHWKKTVGISKIDPTRFAVDFVSNPLSQEQFDRIGGKYLKQFYGSETHEFEVGYKYDLPSKLIFEQQKTLVVGLPKLTVLDKKVLSKQVVGISYELTKDGWVITQEVKGMLK